MHFAYTSGTTCVQFIYISGPTYTGVQSIHVCYIFSTHVFQMYDFYCNATSNTSPVLHVYHSCDTHVAQFLV